MGQMHFFNREVKEEREGLTFLPHLPFLPVNH